MRASSEMARPKGNVGVKVKTVAENRRARFEYFIEDVGSAVARAGMTLIALSIYFNDKGRAKVELAVGRGKNLHDKRETVKDRDWKREAGRIMRDRG